MKAALQSEKKLQKKVKRGKCIKENRQLDTFLTNLRIIQPDNPDPIVESNSRSEASNSIDTLLHTDVVVAVKLINNQTEEEHQFTYQTDLGLWKSVFNDVQDYICSKVNSESVKITDNFEVETVDNPNRIRYCSSALFTRIHLLTNKKFNRTWLCYSPINGKVYCFCVSFSHLLKQIYVCFNDWKNAKRAIEIHEKRPCHLSAILAYIERSRLAGRADGIHEEEVKSQTNFLRTDLQRVVDVIKVWPQGVCHFMTKSLVHRKMAITWVF